MFKYLIIPYKKKLNDINRFYTITAVLIISILSLDFSSMKRALKKKIIRNAYWI